MTPPLRHTLCEHALGNYRVLTTLANELLTTAAQRELSELDEKLYFEVFAPSTQSSRARQRVNPTEPDDMSRKASPHKPNASRRLPLPEAAYMMQFFIEDLYLWFSRAYATQIRWTDLCNAVPNPRISV